MPSTRNRCSPIALREFSSSLASGTSQCRARTLLAAAVVVCSLPGQASAQDAAPVEPRIWTVSASAGLALTSGNSDTSTINAAYDVTFDPQGRNVVKSDGLLIRGKNEGVLSAHRLGLTVRDQYELTSRAFVFGQHTYLRDEFKSIDYLHAPTVGAGYKLFDTERTRLHVDGSLGGVWEKNEAVRVRSSGAVTVSERLTQTVSSTTTLTQSISALWKMNDWDDALYVAGVGLAAAMSARTELKIELLDSYKNRPRLPSLHKNDVTVIMAIVFKS